MWPLVCVLSPRNIPMVIQGHETFSYVPHLWLKYWRAIEAYKILTDFFLEFTHFTHLVISPDDLVVREEHYKQLSHIVEKNDYPVFGGVCNVDIAHPDLMAICKDEVPHIIRKYRKAYRYYNIALEKQKTGIIQVKFAGMPFLFIRRDIVEKICFTGDTVYDETRKHIEPKSFDLAFSYECEKHKIPIHVDLGVKMLHLNGVSDYVNKVNQEKPRVYYREDPYPIKDMTKDYTNFIKELDIYDSRERLKRMGI